MNDHNDFSFDDADADLLLGLPPDESAEVIDLRQFLINGLAADAADDEALTGRPAQDLDWQDLGLCKESDPEAFFPEKGGSTRQAKSVCKRCPSIDACLEYALDNGERFGIWGGKSELERRQILNARKTAEAASRGVVAAGLGRVG